MKLRLAQEQDEEAAAEQATERERAAENISRQNDEKIARGRPEGGRAKAAREIGVDENAARRAEKVAALAPEAKAAARRRAR